MRAGCTFFPHHDARMTSGRPSRTASGSTMRSLASAAVRRCGKIGVPPAISTSSSTQRMPEISGSSHSSKNTRGRTGNRAAAARIASRPASSSSASASARACEADEPAQHADHLQDLGDAPLIERHDRVAAPHELGGDVGLQIREREDRDPARALRSCRTARSGTPTPAASAAPPAAAPCSRTRRRRDRRRPSRYSVSVVSSVRQTMRWG